MNPHKIAEYVRQNPKRILLTALPQAFTLLFGYVALTLTQQAAHNSVTLSQALATLPNPIEVQQLPLAAGDYQRIGQTMSALYPSLKFTPEPDGLRINATDTSEVITWFSALDTVMTIEPSTRWRMPEACISAKNCNPVISGKVVANRDNIRAR